LSLTMKCSGFLISRRSRTPLIAVGECHLALSVTVKKENNTYNRIGLILIAN